jgi:hypothetical protein
MNDPLPPGTRIRLIAMPDDPDPVPPGTAGTIKTWTAHQGWAQIQVVWDNGRHLSLCFPPDRFEILP